jgi:hypothetical protein
MQKFCKQILLFILFLSCERKPASEPKGTFLLEGPEGKEAVIYRVVKAGMGGRHAEYLPHVKVGTNVSIPLEAGHYLIANECSSFPFEHKASGESRIKLSNVRLDVATVPVPPPTATGNEDLPEKDRKDSNIDPSELQDMIAVSCIDPIEERRQEWTTKLDFQLFAKESRIWIGGRLFKFGNEGKVLPPHMAIKLYPVLVQAPGAGLETRVFFTAEQGLKGENNPIFYGRVGRQVWLPMGNYIMEVNGSRRKLAVGIPQSTVIRLGILRIESPTQFPMEERLKQGAPPIFAYLNEGVLLNLNTDYLMLPGEYSVNIEGTDVKAKYVVSEGEKTVVHTRGAVIENPPCPEKYKSCKIPPRITLHADKAPYVLMTVEPNTPFLVLDGKYEFGVEGTRGVLKNLEPSEKGVTRESLARVKINWEVRPSTSRVRTDLVRLESMGGANSGRTLDLLFSKPEEVYVPAGHYQLTYFVGDPALERSKTRVDVHVNSSETREVIVPIYTEKGTGGRNDMAQTGNRGEKENQDSPQELPSQLVPLRR